MIINYKKFIICFIFVALMMPYSIQGIIYFQSTNTISSDELKNPKASAGGITINTPENKTYTEPESGYYPATYGFESGTTGLEISDLGGSVDIIPSLDGHNKILALADTSASNRIDVQQFFNQPDQNYGTIEFWVRTTDHGSNKQQYISFVQYEESWDESDYLFAIVLNLYGWNNRGYAVIDNVPSLADNIWFHCRIDFESTSGGYTGLSQYYWRFTVNGIPSDPLPYLNSLGGMDFILFQTGTEPSGMTLYVDALDYSWNNNYDIGDNLIEGLLLSYDNTTTLNWQGYSLDGQTNKTIIGNTTIPFPLNGEHRIQVFGNDSLGGGLESNLQYFSVNTSNRIDIVAPEERIYTDPDLGYFLGTYGFENETVGNIPTSWTIWPGSAQVSVKDEIGNHKRVLEFYDTSSVYESTAYNSFPGQSSGSIECWIRTSDASQRYGIYLLEGWNNYKVILYIDGNELQYKDSTSVKTIVGGIINNHWYHLRIDFECSSSSYQGLEADRFYVSLDGNRYGSFEFNTPGNYVTEFYAGPDGLASNIHCYLDAVGYSWDPNYEIGNNLNEGLLLSYDIKSALNWQGYSLDGMDNKTIFGNTTIPIPMDGQHQIQVFGSDSYGNIYASEIRYFETNIFPPVFYIVSPQFGDIVGFNPPNFELSVLDPNIDSMWYTLDGGTTNYTFTQLTGQIDVSEWSKYDNGSVQILFFVKDEAGHIAFSEIEIEKDLIAPIITINLPQFGTVYSDLPPLFDISIDEDNLDSYWYSFDGGTTNYSVNELTGITSESAWGALPNGYVTLTFYALDKAGNIAQKSIVITKQVESPQPPTIPGYDLYLLIGLLSITVLILIRARKYKI